MKKSFTLLMLTFVLASLSFAQGKPSIKFGVKAGLNLSSQYINVEQFKGNSAFLSNYHFTGLIDFPVSLKFSIQPGVSLSGKGAKYDYNGSGVDPTFGPYQYTYTGNSNVMYVEVPLNAIVKINALYFGVGPYYAYAVSGKKDINLRVYNDFGEINTPDEGEIKFGNEQGNDLKRTDYGVNFLFGYQFESGFNLGLNGGLGLYNIRPANGEEGKNRVVSISIGYIFSKAFDVKSPIF